MKYTDWDKGFILTGTSIIVTLIMVILIPVLFGDAFFINRSADIDTLRQQAYYNANSGVEYARFIIEHSTMTSNPSYDPFTRSTWPKSTPFQCFANNPSLGQVTVSIVSDGSNGYNITTTGSTGSISQTINTVHLVGRRGGKIYTWQ